MSAELIKAVGSLALSATAKYVAAISLTFRTEAVAALVTLTGLPRSTVYRAQGEFMQQATDEMIRFLNIRPTDENPECLTDGIPDSPTDEKHSEKPVSLVGIPSCAPTCAGATKELPSEVVILDNNTPPNPLTVAKPKRERADGPTPMDANTAFHAWNATALRCGLPQAAKLTPDRQRKIIARLKEYGLDGWSQALANIEKSSFLTGGSNTGFRADLDFLVQSKSFGKVHDGGYGNGRHTAKPKAEVRMRPMTAEEIELYRNAGIF